MKQMVWIMAGVLAAAVLSAEEQGKERGVPVQEQKAFRPQLGSMMEGDIPMPSALGMAKELDLSKEQQQQIRAILESKNAEMKTLREKMEAGSKRQAELISQDTPDEAAILKSLDELSAVRLEIARIRVHQVLEVQKLLTPEQRAKIRERMKERMDRKNTGEQRRRNADAARHERRAKAGETAPAAPAVPPVPAASTNVPAP